jgi:hypothetical protein
LGNDEEDDVTIYFVNRELSARAEMTFQLDIPSEIEILGNQVIKAYIKANSEWREYVEIDVDCVIFEKDSE